MTTGFTDALIARGIAVSAPTDWPIRGQAPSVAEKGYNVQVGFLLFRKPE